MSKSISDLLSGFAGTLPGGASNPIYQAVANAINQSASLQQQLSNAPINGISYVTGQTGGDYDPATGYINLSANIISTIMNLSVADQANDFIFTLSHEAQHAYDAADVQSEINTEIGSEPPAGSSSEVNTAWAAGYQNIGLQDEGKANIQGMNTVIQNAIAQNGGNPLSQSQFQDLLNNTPLTYTLYTKDNGTWVLDGGLTVNQDGTGTVPLSSENIEAAGQIVSTIPTSTSVSQDYGDFYTVNPLTVLSQINGGSFSISYSGLGLTTPTMNTATGLASGSTPYTTQQVDDAIASGNYGEVPDGTTITNSDNGIVSVFHTNTSSGTTVTISPLPGSSGDADTYQETDSISSDGSIGIDINGTGDVVAISGATITLEPGSQATINGSGNTVNLLGDETSAQVNGSGNAIALEGNSQTLTTAQGYGNTVTAASGSTNEAVNGSGAVVNTGDGSQFALNGMSFTFNGGANTHLNIAGGFNTATLGDGSQVTLSAPTTTGGFVGLNTINESNGTIIVAFNDSAYGADTLNGSGNTITSASGAFDINGNNNVFTGSGLGSYFGITGDNNTFSNSSGGGIFLLRGSNNTVSSGSGGTFEIYSGTGNTLTASGATVELVAMGTTTINGSNDTFDLDSTGDDTLNVSGSGNTIDALEGGQINLVSGSNFDIYTENGTINAGVNVSAIIELDDEQITASNGDSFQIVNGDNTFTAAAGSTVTFSDEEQDLSGDSITVAQGAIVLGDKTEFTINGDTNAISGGNQDVIILKGSDDFVSGTNDAITFNGPLDGGDNSLSISGTGNKLTATNAAIAFIDGQAGDSLQITGVGDTISATDKSIDFYTNAGNATVIGAGDTLSGSEQTLTLSGSSMTDATVLSLTSSTISAGVGNFVISGYGNTFTGIAGSQLNVTDSGNIVNISNATITVADNTSLTIVGSNDQINGGDSDGLTITGTDDVVTATNSSIVFGQNNSGDTVTGAGDGGSNWSAPDPDLPAGDNGGYTPPNNSTATVALHSLSHSKHAMGTEVVSRESGRMAAPDINSLVHAMAAFHAEGNGMAVDSSLTSSSPTEHLHLAAAA